MLELAPDDAENLAHSLVHRDGAFQEIIEAADKALVLNEQGYGNQ